MVFSDKGKRFAHQHRQEKIMRPNSSKHVAFFRRPKEEKAYHTKKQVGALHDGMLQMLKEMQQDKMEIALLRERVTELERAVAEAEARLTY